MCFNVNFNVFFKLIKVHLLVSELYIYQNAQCNDKKKTPKIFHIFRHPLHKHITEPKTVQSICLDTVHNTELICDVTTAVCLTHSFVS